MLGEKRREVGVIFQGFLVVFVDGKWEKGGMGR